MLWLLETMVKTYMIVGWQGMVLIGLAMLAIDFVYWFGSRPIKVKAASDDWKELIRKPSLVEASLPEERHPDYQRGHVDQELEREAELAVFPLDAPNTTSSEESKRNSDLP